MEVQRIEFQIALKLEENQVTWEIPVEALREEAHSRNSVVVHLEKRVAWFEDLLLASWEGRQV